MWLATMVYLTGGIVTVLVTSGLVYRDALHRLKSRHGRTYEPVDWLLAATSVVGMSVFWPVTVLSVAIVWLALNERGPAPEGEDPISPRI